MVKAFLITYNYLYFAIFLFISGLVIGLHEFIATIDYIYSSDKTFYPFGDGYLSNYWIIQFYYILFSTTLGVLPVYITCGSTTFNISGSNIFNFICIMILLLFNIAIGLLLSRVLIRKSYYTSTL